MLKGLTAGTTGHSKLAKKITQHDWATNLHHECISVIDDVGFKLSVDGLVKYGFDLEPVESNSWRRSYRRQCPKHMGPPAVSSLCFER